MARARRRSSGMPKLLIALLVIAVLVALGWSLLHRRPHWMQSLQLPSALTNTPTPTASAGANVSATRIDPAHEGERVNVEGELRVGKPARDGELGISADAIVLQRIVEMRQWQEECSSRGCDYTQVWSSKPIDSHAFREAKGHANGVPFPFSSTHFLAEDVRLGAFAVDAASVADTTPVAYPVHVAQLRPNLAATLREQDGALTSSADPAHPAIGDLRISYRIIATGTRKLSGVQQANRLNVGSTR